MIATAATVFVARDTSVADQPGTLYFLIADDGGTMPASPGAATMTIFLNLSGHPSNWICCSSASTLLSSPP